MKSKIITIVSFVALFSLSTAKAQEITMFSGFFDYQYYQDNERINKKDLVVLLKKNKESYAHWKKSKTFGTLSLVSLVAETGFFAWQLKNRSKNIDQTGQFIGVTASFVGVVTFALLSHSQKKKSILKYNQSLEKKATFEIKPSKNGLGIVLQF